MPIYSYHCKSCGKEFELSRSVSDPDVTDCPYCDAKGSVKKVFGDVGVIFKGTGYYCTDHPHGEGCSCGKCKGK